MKHFFWTQKFLRPKIFLTQNLVGHKKFSELTFFWTQQFLVLKILLDPTCTWKWSLTLVLAQLVYAYSAALDLRRSSNGMDLRNWLPGHLIKFVRNMLTLVWTRLNKKNLTIWDWAGPSSVQTGNETLFYFIQDLFHQIDETS